MSEEHLETVRTIYDCWERGDFAAGAEDLDPLQAVGDTVVARIRQRGIGITSGADPHGKSAFPPGRPELFVLASGQRK
jgi:hypothetical protein